MNIEVYQDGEPIFSGNWREAPEDVRRYIEAAEKHHGAEALRDYMLRKGTPTALGMKGYEVRVV